MYNYHMPIKGNGGLEHRRHNSYTKEARAMSTYDSTQLPVESQDNGSTPVPEHPYQFDNTANALKLLAEIEEEMAAAAVAVLEAKYRIERAKEAARDLATKELHRAFTVDNQAAIELATQLYWFHQDVPATSITSVLGASPQNITEFIGAALIKVKCIHCGNSFDMILKSRTALKAAREARHTCTECDDKARQTREEETHAYREQIAAEHEYLRTMPYGEYLQTDHWQNLRTRMLKRAGYSCQVCNSKNVSLHVHHRTYANRGNEDYSDLIVLCANCHGKFHDKLAVQE